MSLQYVANKYFGTWSCNPMKMHSSDFLGCELYVKNKDAGVTETGNSTTEVGRTGGELGQDNITNSIREG